ncbi:MAG: hypothetical protein GOVbin1782_58 [Prokaryotic dsDNA virus sp.]|nr:MAG: hypothetical protein GOVbin1782_58 [Prokaryotic dsDNA virus sp.]|tara:strand:+ start:851 stop:1147 length:297 start_codon:yes stop_codon:yes gene_type:complete
MDDDDVFEAVREINKLMHEAKVKTDIANKALKDAEGLLKELLDATRKKTTQTSLDDFATKSSSDNGLNVPVAKRQTVAHKRISELLSLDDISKMLLED